MELKKLADLTRRDLDEKMSPSKVRRCVQQGTIPHRRINGRIYVEVSVLEELVRGRSVPAKPPAKVGVA